MLDFGLIYFLVFLTHFGKFINYFIIFMNKITFTIIIFLTIPLLIFPQEKRFFDAPFGGGGGYLAGWYIPNVNPVNEKLKSFGVPELSKSGMYTSGGGFIYIGFIKFLRVGGMGFGGSVSEKAVVNGYNREAVYSIGGGGLSIEYSLPFIRDFGVSVGAIIGGGSMQIQLYNNSGNFSWDGVWDETPGNNTSTNNISRTISNTYWNFTPTLNVDIPFNRFVALRVGTGYQITFANSWRVDNDIELTNVPSDLNANSFFVQAGVYLGFFSF